MIAAALGWKWLTGPHLVWCVLWVGLCLLTIALVVLLWTRWGQSQPLRKCIVLSLLAHLLLAGYSTTVKIVTVVAEEQAFAEHTISLAEISTGDSFDESPAHVDPTADQPWEAFAESAIHPEAVELDRADPIELAALERALPTPDRSPDNETTADFESAQRREPEAIEDPAATRRDPTATAMPIVNSPERADATSSEVPSANNPTSIPLTDARDEPKESPFDPEEIFETGEESLDPSVPGGRVVSTGQRLSPAGLVAVDPARRGSHGDRPAEDLLRPRIEPTVGPSSSRRVAGDSGSVPEVYSLRNVPNRADRVAEQGGNSQTEAAVGAALKWLAANQSQGGNWDASQLEAGRGTATAGQDRKGAGTDADTGVTGLALLAFLGAGHTHERGSYTNVVAAGLDYLIRSQAADGSLGGQAKTYEWMYCHAMAAFALSEAYAMTGDERLERPVRRAVAYTLSAQHPTTGGWRYRPGDQGDTSQLGWQLMALKSAELGGISIPANCREGMERFLDSVASGHRQGLASYRPGERATRTMTAEALACRQFLLIDRPAASDEAADFVLQELPGDGETNVYYWYYATLALHQKQGTQWRQWNDALLHVLPAQQRTDGSFAGSWDPDPVWGRHGGRAFSTAVSALCLEVYYRYLPLYIEASARRNRHK